MQNSLLLRRATGQFYGVQFDNNLRKLKLLGTNHFTYDRANSSETEDFSQSDVIPLMLCEGKAGEIWAAPFIGDRKHAHTSYNDSATDDKQDIIVVQAVTDTAHFFYYTTGTTQPVIPYKLPVSNKHFMELNFGTTPYDLYDACWSKFNNILLNHPTYLDGRVRFTMKNISANPLNISPEELTERFVRGDVSRTTEGSGLGLSIARSLTELQGGDFGIEIDGDYYKASLTFDIVKPAS